MSGDPRILVVDDDIAVRKSLSIVLAQAGYAVDTAQTGEEAITKSDSNFYHLALIDYRLSDMVGTKLLTLIRDTVPRMMKVIMTGHPSLDTAIEAINRGVDGYFTKPLNGEQLLKTIKQLLEKQARDQEFTEQKLLLFVNSRFKHGRSVQRDKEIQSRLKVRIADCQLPGLLYVFLSIGSSPVSFGGVAYGEEGERLRKRLKVLAEEKAILYEAVDKDGAVETGLCSVEGLKFDETPTNPIRVKYSGQLAHPFIK